MLGNRIDRLASRALALAAALVIGLTASAQARTFVDVDIVVDLKDGKFDAALYEPGKSAFKLTSPREVADGVFTLLDLKVILKDEATAKLIAKTIDEGFAPELGECDAASIGAMAMQDGVRYSFALGQGAERVRATLFTGSRSTHWANDFFCQFDPVAGPEGAAMRVVGFFYVIHRPLAEGVDIQLRPVVPTPDEADSFLKLKQARRKAAEQQ